jgi:hypothetical protein
MRDIGQRHGARQHLAAVDAQRRGVTRACRGRAHDVGLDHHVGRAANHQQMLDVVAADDDELAPSVDRRGIDHRKPRLAVARAGLKTRDAEPADQPGGRTDQPKHDDKGDDEVHRRR